MKSKNRFSITSLTTLALALICAMASATAKADLFSSATVAEADSVSKVDSDILKRRVVKVNFKEIAQLAQVGAKFLINLFDDVSLKGTVEKIENRGAKNYTLSGRLDSDEYSSFTISVFDDVVAMNVRTLKDFYQVRSVRNGLHEIFQMADHAFGGCNVKPEHSVAAPVAGDEPAPGQAQADAGDIVDVMVVYTPTARGAAGSSNAMMAQINLAVTEANTAYTLSQINMQIRLVYAGEVSSYVTEAGMSTDLSRLANPSDGYMDEVHTLRNTYGADLVSLWVNDSSACGLAYVMTTLTTNFAPNGFSCVYWGPGCATGYYSFAHEMGHNMGCTHDVANSGGQGLYPYSYGWRFNGTNGAQYRTVMAYAPGTRVQRFSNPDVNYVGTPTGVAVGQANQAHNVQTINNTALTVANFRQTVSTNPFPEEITLPIALDNTGFSWDTFGFALWTGQNTVVHDGVDAAVSGTIGDDEYTSFDTPIVGPGTLSFWWKVSSESGFDWLDVFLDANLLDLNGISGTVDWTSRTFPIPAGIHQLTFQYSKDESFFVGQDRGWVDQISYIGISSFEPSSLGKTNGLFKLTFNGLPGASYTLQASTNLTSWTPLTNVILNTLEGNLFIDVGSSNLTSRFYRIVSP